MPIKDIKSVVVLFRDSLSQSYYNLYFKDPKNFPVDMLDEGTNPEEAIEQYATNVAANLETEWESKDFQSIIAYDQANVAGFATFGIDINACNPLPDVKSYYIYYLGVASSHFKNGVGSNLMSSVINEYISFDNKESQGYSIKLHTRSFNKPAFRLYEKFGFEVKENDFAHGPGRSYRCYMKYGPRLTVENHKLEILANKGQDKLNTASVRFG